MASRSVFLVGTDSGATVFDTGVVVVGSGGTAVSAIALTVAPLSVPPLSSLPVPSTAAMVGCSYLAVSSGGIANGTVVRRGGAKTIVSGTAMSGAGVGRGRDRRHGLHGLAGGVVGGHCEQHLVSRVGSGGTASGATMSGTGRWLSIRRPGGFDRPPTSSSLMRWCPGCAENTATKNAGKPLADHSIS